MRVFVYFQCFFVMPEGRNVIGNLKFWLGDRIGTCDRVMNFTGPQLRGMISSRLRNVKFRVRVQNMASVKKINLFLTVIKILLFFDWNF